RLCSLPIEILHDIVFYLDTPSFVVLASTNQLLMTLFYDDHVWLCRFQHDFHTLTTQDWKQRHMALYRNHSILSSRWMAGQVTTHYLPDGHQDSVYCMTRFGQHHMISGSRDRCLKLWHLPTSKLIMTKRTPHDGSVLCLAVSPDSSTLITGSSDATCILWSLPSMRRIGTLKGHRHGVLDVCYLPDGQTVVSSSRDHTLIIWHQGKELYRLLGHVGPVNSVKVYDADHVVSASGDCTLKIWNVRTGRCRQQPINHGGFACVQVDRERGLIYTGGHNGKLGIWHVDTGKCEASLPGHHALIRSMHRFGSSWILNILVTRSRILSAGQDKQIMMLDFGHALQPLDE
ncbi:WD40 repeat-like protein, partial [Hesseltinella vesiculosa]